MQIIPYFALTFCHTYSPLALVDILCLPVTSQLSRQGLLLILTQKVFISLGKKKKKKTQRKWQVTFSFSQHSNPCLQCRRQICRPSHVILRPPPSPREARGSAADQCSGQRILIWMQMRRGKCLDTLSFAFQISGKGQRRRRWTRVRGTHEISRPLYVRKGYSTCLRRQTVARTGITYVSARTCNFLSRQRDETAYSCKFIPLYRHGFFLRRWTVLRSPESWGK